jgi:hypothetical protein
MSYLLASLLKKIFKDLMTSNPLHHNIITISLTIINIISLIYINNKYKSNIIRIIPLILINIISYIFIKCLIKIYLFIIKIIKIINIILSSLSSLLSLLSFSLKNKKDDINSLKLQLEDKNKIIDNQTKYINELKIQYKANIKDINDLKIQLQSKNGFIYEQELLEIRQNIIDALKLQLEDKNKIIDNQTKYINNYKIQYRANIKDINALKLQLEDKNKIINDLTIKNDETNKCSICLDNTISHCCVPCGHTYCSDCINESNNCYICRGIIHNKIKIYL